MYARKYVVWGSAPTTRCRVEMMIYEVGLIILSGATEMNGRNLKSVSWTNIRSRTGASALAALVPFTLFAALLTALAFLR